MRSRSTSDPNDVSAQYNLLDAWLRRRRLALLLVIVALAVTLRALCFLELADSPIASLHRWQQSDMSTLHRSAVAIAGGDLWFKSSSPPLHDWHLAIADDSARLFPERWAQLLAGHGEGDGREAAARALWDRWAGGGRTYQGPLYTYLVALTYALFSERVLWVFAWQMMIGALSIVLVHLLTRRLFGDVAAVLAAAMALLYGPLLFFELVLLRTTLISLTGLLLVLLLSRSTEVSAATRPLFGVGRSWLAVGLTLGLALGLKAHFSLMVIAALAALAAWAWGRWRRAGVALAMLTVGVAVGFGPVVARNLESGAPPFSTASSGRPAFVVYNVEGAGYASWGARNAAEVLAVADAGWSSTIVATLRTHPSASSYLRLIWDKARATWRSYEEPNNTSYYYGELFSRVLRALPVSFGMIGPLAILGLALSLWGAERRRLLPLLALVATNLVVLHGFLVLSRYRAPLVVALLPFAAFGLSRLLRALLSRRWGLAAALALFMLAGFGLSHASSPRPRVRLTDVSTGYMVHYDPRLQVALRTGSWDAAAGVLAESLEHLPPEIESLGPARRGLSAEEAQLARLYADVYRQHAGLLERAGRFDEARAQSRRSEELLRAAGAQRSGGL